MIGCYRLLNAETTNHAQPLIERVPKSHGGLVLTASRSDFVISLFRSRFDLIFFFLPGVAQIRIFMGKIRTPVFYINSRTKYGKNVLVGMSVKDFYTIFVSKLQYISTIIHPNPLKVYIFWKTD